MADIPQSDPKVIDLLTKILTQMQQQNSFAQTAVSRQNIGIQQIQNWKNQNKELSAQYGKGAQLADKLMHGFMAEMVGALDEITDEDTFNDFGGGFEGDYRLTEFIDKYGARVQQLNTLLQMLSNLGTKPQ